MVKLTLNEEKVRKELLRFSNGARACQLMEELVMTHTPLYRALNSLEEKELAFRGDHSLWHPYLHSGNRDTDSTASKPEESEQDKARAEIIRRSTHALAGYNEPVYFRRLPDESRK